MSVYKQQHGVITRQQAIRVGASPSMVDRLSRRGTLVAEGAGVFRASLYPTTWHQRVMIAALSVDESAVASHETAAAVWRLIDFRPDVIHITVRRRRWRSRDFVVHRSTDLAPEHIQSMEGIPTTSVARTLIDMGSTAGPAQTERALDNALRRGLVSLGLLTEMVDELARQGRRGVPVVRELVIQRRSWTDSTESELEDQFRRLLTRAGVPLPTSQFEVRSGDGALVGRVDFAYPDTCVLIELDGYAYHSDPAAFVRDRERQNALMLAGYQVLRYTASDLRTRPEAVVTEVASAAGFPVNGSVGIRRFH